MPKIPSKISGFPLSVSWLVDKIAKFTEIFFTYIHSYSSHPHSHGNSQTTNEPTKQQKNRERVFLF